MRSLRLLACVALAVAAMACSDDAAVGAPDAGDPDAGAPDAAVPQAVEFQGWTVTGETPVLAGDGTVTGSVTFARISGGDTRGGGACLVADLNNSFPCATSADCASLTLPAGGFHYCVNVNGAGDKTCWTRPSATPCTRGDRTPGTYSTPAVPGLVDASSTTWMTVGCMAADGVPMGCASPDPTMYIYATSPTLFVPAP